MSMIGSGTGRVGGTRSSGGFAAICASAARNAATKPSSEAIACCVSAAICAWNPGEAISAASASSGSGRSTSAESEDMILPWGLKP